MLNTDQDPTFPPISLHRLIVLLLLAVVRSSAVEIGPDKIKVLITFGMRVDQIFLVVEDKGPSSVISCCSVMIHDVQDEFADHARFSDRDVHGFIPHALVTHRRDGSSLELLLAYLGADIAIKFEGAPYDRSIEPR